ncbi:MAG: peptide ABC transporter substrate-binding protein [Woeseiaceae bacterium]|nr:peptide ABC transporter substrate-binding protein [Woeseiaceae bacterium]
MWFLAGLLGGCGPGETPHHPENVATNGERKILRIAYDREIDVLNAYTSQMLVDISFSMVEGLVTTNDRNSYVPVLAKQIPTEENGLIVMNDDGTVDMTWQLHEGVRWHDGEGFSSDDVCFTWRFVTSTGSQTYNRDQYLGIIDCLMPDEHTVVFRWDDVYGYYAGLFEAVLPEHVLGGMTTDEIVNYTPYNRGPEMVGTGPFRFAEWKSGEYIRVVRNDDYWRGGDYPAIDEVVWAFIPDSNTRLNAMKARRYDYARIEPTQVAEAERIDGYRVHLVSSNSFMHLDLSLNTERARNLFGDAAVRRAMFHAIDRQAIADQLMQGTVRLANSPINPTSPYHNPDIGQPGFDPQRAGRLLDELGWTLGPDGIRQRHGERFSFVMINRAGQADRIAVAQVIQAQLKDIGIEVKFETLESAAWTNRWRNFQWEGIVSAWYLSADPSITSQYLCDGPNNMTSMCDPELDELLLASDRSLNFDTRKKYLDDAQARLAETSRMLPLYYNVIPEIVNTRVRNYRGSGTNFGSFWNLYEWRLNR